mmetsp:Transcript_19618/g.45891  ORF Transcript_19618/g.45891 Transcript_19618/m.45891 type:complete len:238 (+) Transcript_19618:133-846(+)
MHAAPCSRSGSPRSVRPSEHSPGTPKTTTTIQSSSAKLTKHTRGTQSGWAGPSCSWRTSSACFTRSDRWTGSHVPPLGHDPGHGHGNVPRPRRTRRNAGRDAASRNAPNTRGALARGDGSTSPAGTATTSGGGPNPRPFTSVGRTRTRGAFARGGGSTSPAGTATTSGGGPTPRPSTSATVRRTPPATLEKEKRPCNDPSSRRLRRRARRRRLPRVRIRLDHESHQRHVPRLEHTPL